MDEINIEKPEELKQIYTPPKGNCFKLEVFDWLKNIPKATERRIVEVRFKNTRKDFFENVNDLKLKQGDIVAVESSPGHDTGIVSLTGELVVEQMKRCGFTPPAEGLKKIYRVAKQSDLDKWNEAKSLEFPTMIKSRRIAKQLNLNMKIGDVEYQGDKTKAIFYYIAEERVDFRELIKVLGEEFHIKVEMKQIGARQEAARIGGIATCGKELCCASYMRKYVSVSMDAARYQEISLNLQKLAGQCGKLKCCLNFEVDSYIDAQKDFPDKSISLKFKDGEARHQKTDVYKRIMWYSYFKDGVQNLVEIPVNRVSEIITLNKKGEIVEKLVEDMEKKSSVGISFVYGTNEEFEESLAKLDDSDKNHKNRKKPNPRPKQGRPNYNHNNNNKKKPENKH